MKITKTLTDFIAKNILNVELLQSGENDPLCVLYKDRKILVKVLNADGVADLSGETPDIYIFALFPGEFESEKDFYDASLWDFFVAPASAVRDISENQNELALKFISPIALKNKQSGLKKTLDLLVNI